MRARLAFCAATLTLCGAARITAAPAAQAAPGSRDDERDLRELEPGQSVRAGIAGGQEHAYGLALQAGEYVKVVVDQHGVDVVIAARGPDGGLMVEANFRATADGTDWLSLQAETGGRYHIALRPRLSDAAAGSYELKLVGPRPATARDRAAARADGLLAEGHALTREGSAASREKAALRMEEAAVAYREAQNTALEARALGDAGNT